MPAPQGTSPESASRHAYAHAAFGALIMATALGLAIGVSDLADEHLGWSERSLELLRGGLTSLLAVPAIVSMQTRRDRRPMSELGLPGLHTSIRTFGIGFGLTLGIAVALAALALLVGVLEIVAVDWPGLWGWLAVTIPFAFFYEALPEELTFRGYAYTRLSSRLDAGRAIAFSLLLFCAAPFVASVVHWLINVATGIDGPGPRLAPGGETPISYLSMLLLFGYTLHVARLTTGSLWTSIGLHLAFLLFNRQVLSDDADTGLAIEMTDPWGRYLVPAYLVAVLIALNARVEQRDPSPGRRGAPTRAG